MVANNSIDLAFSFDSLVHAEQDAELSRVLAAEGVAFLHHSNMGAYEPGTYDSEAIHWRATSVSATLIERLARSVGLRCISQETAAWGNDALLNDCFSVITRAGSRWDHANVVTDNLDFTRVEIAMANRLSTQYAPSAREVRFGCQHVRPIAAEHAQALALLERDEPETARGLLRDQMRRAIDPEALNDLAVLTMRCGDREETADLLRALVRLHPEHAAARRELSYHSNAVVEVARWAGRWMRPCAWGAHGSRLVR